MRRLLFILFLLLPLIIVAQAPIWRNSFTTNQAPPVIGTNVGISNTASSFMWKFYGGSDPNRVAVLSDITGGSATNAIGNLNGYGTNTTFFGPLVWGSTNVMEEIETMIKRSNGFGTNLTLLGLRFSMSTTGLVYTNFAATYPRVGIATNFPQSILHINTEYPSMCSLLVASNNWQGVNPSLIITNGFVGIGQHRPISELELKGNEVVSGWIRVTNGLRVAGGMAVIQDFTNSGTAYLTNTPTSGNNQTALAINTNAVSGVAVVQIAAGTNGSTGRAPTNQYVILYTNAIYGKGFAVETNGNVTASAFNGSSSPGGGAFIADLNGNGTNTTLYSVGSSNIAYWTDKEWTLTNTGYGTRMRWQAPLGTLKTDGGLGVGGGATIGDGMLVTNNVVVFGAVYAQGFTNTSAPAIFSDVTPSKIAVFGPDRDLTNSTIDAADLAKIGATNFDSLFVTNTLVASNIVSTNFTVDTFTSSTLQLSNALEVRFGGTGTNTNVLGAFFIGNGTNPVVFLDTNTYANWLSNQIANAGIGGGTNFPMVRVTNMADVGLGILLRTNVLPTAAQIGNSRGMSLSVSNIADGKLAELWFMYTTNGNALHVPMRQDFGGTKFDKQIHTYGGGQFYQTSTTTNDYFFRGALSGASGIYIRPQVATNDGAGGYGGLMDMALRTDVTNNPTIYYPSIVGAITNNIIGQGLFTVTNASTAKGMVVGTNGNLAISGAFTSGGAATINDNIFGLYSVRAGSGSEFYWNNQTRLSSQTNGTFKAGNYSSTATTVGNGAAMLFDPVVALPFPAANKGVLTNNQIGLANTDGTFVIITSTNGTNLYIVAGLNPTNGLWVSNHVTVLGTNYATAFVGNGSLLTGLPSGSTNFDNISVGTNAMIGGSAFITNNLTVQSNVFAISNVAVGGLFQSSNGVVVGPKTIANVVASDLSDGAAASRKGNAMVLWMSNNIGHLTATYDGTNLQNVATFTTNGNVNVATALSSGAGMSAGQGVSANSGYSLNWSSSSRIFAPTNGTAKLVASGGAKATVGSGATWLFDPVDKFPWADYSTATLTNNQFALGNTNGELRFFTGTNGTSIPDATSRRSIDAFGINASNVWTRTALEPKQPIACYGAMMFGNTNYGQVFGASAYTNIVGFNVWNTNWFIVNTNTGYMTNVFAGYYRCTINISMLGQNSGIYEGCMLTNDVDSELIGFKHQHDTPARLRSASGIGVIYLPANTGCSFAMKCDVPGSIQIHRGSMTIGTP